MTHLEANDELITIALDEGFTTERVVPIFAGDTDILYVRVLPHETDEETLDRAERIADFLNRKRR